MKVLLDTHALLWAMLSPAKLSPAAAATIAEETNDILISAAAAWEIATKVRLGKLPGAERLERDFLALIAQAGYDLIVIDGPVALRAGRLAGTQGDPFDRMMAAHALAGDLPVISADTKLDGFGIRRIW